MKHPREQGHEDYRRGRANRATAQDDNSMLGRGHPFGPDTSSASRRRPRSTTQEDRGPPARSYGRLADDREARGPETGHFLEDDSYTRGSMGHQGYGSRSRSMESTRRLNRDRKRDEFDDDLVR